MARPLAWGMRGAARTALAVAFASTSACGLALGLDATGSLGFDRDAGAAKDGVGGTSPDAPSTMPFDASTDARPPDAAADAEIDGAPDTVVPMDAPGPPVDTGSIADTSATADSATADSSMLPGGDSGSSHDARTLDTGTTPADSGTVHDSTSGTDGNGGGSPYGVYINQSAWHGSESPGGEVSFQYAPASSKNVVIVAVAFAQSATPTVTFTDATGSSMLAGCGGAPGAVFAYAYGAGLTLEITISPATQACYAIATEFTMGAGISGTTPGCLTGGAPTVALPVNPGTGSGGGGTVALTLFTATGAATISPPTGWNVSDELPTTFSVYFGWQSNVTSGGYDPSWTVESPSQAMYAATFVQFTLQ